MQMSRMLSVKWVKHDIRLNSFKNLLERTFFIYDPNCFSAVLVYR